MARVLIVGCGCRGFASSAAQTTTQPTSQVASSEIANSLREVFADEDNVDIKLAEIVAVDVHDSHGAIRHDDGHREIPGRAAQVQ